VDEVPNIVREMYRLVDRLEEKFPGRHFTLDGHVVGSLGEIIAAHRYGLELLPHSFEGHDAKTPRGYLVQVKATQRTSVALRSEPQHLIVLQLKRNGSAEEVYNGPGEAPWVHAGKMQKNGQRPISLSKLTELMRSVSKDQRLPEVAS